jgi:hypothetical protein
MLQRRSGVALQTTLHHASEQDDIALSWTLSQIGGDPTTVRNEAMNAVTFAGGSASALSA